MLEQRLQEPGRAAHVSSSLIFAAVACLLLAATSAPALAQDAQICMAGGRSELPTANTFLMWIKAPRTSLSAGLGRILERGCRSTFCKKQTSTSWAPARSNKSAQDTRALTAARRSNLRHRR